MSDKVQQLIEDRQLRDTARANLMADVEHIKQSLSGKGMATRVASRIGDGAFDVFEVAKTQADDKRGIIAILIGAIVLWLSRHPIAEILGLTDPEEGEEATLETNDQSTQTTTDPVEPDDEPSGGDDDERTDD